MRRGVGRTDLPSDGERQPERSPDGERSEPARPQPRPDPGSAAANGRERPESRSEHAGGLVARNRELFGTDPALVKRIPVDNLHVIKISYPRPHPQGWMRERDMHAGQQFARLMELEVE